MKQHIMLALGILLLAIFFGQGYLALMEPGWGLKEAYVAGGLFLAGWLIKGGFTEMKHAKNRK